MRGPEISTATGRIHALRAIFEKNSRDLADVQRFMNRCKEPSDMLKAGMMVGMIRDDIGAALHVIERWMKDKAA